LRRDVFVDDLGLDGLQDAHLLGLPQVAGVHGQQQVGRGVLAFSLDALVEWMTTPEAQAIFAGTNQEFPANPDVSPSSEVASWGDFKADELPVEVAGKRQAEAIRMMDRAGWN